MEISMISDRSEVTNMIRAAKVRKNISWAEVAGAIGQSKEMDDGRVPWPDGDQQGSRRRI